MTHERLWTLGNKLRASEGRRVRNWDRLVMGIKEGMYCMVHWVLYTNNESWNTMLKKQNNNNKKQVLGHTFEAWSVAGNFSPSDSVYSYTPGLSQCSQVGPKGTPWGRKIQAVLPSTGLQPKRRDLQEPRQDTDQKGSSLSWS